MNQCPQCKTVWQDWRKFCENDGCRLVNQVEQGDKPVAVLFDGPHSDRGRNTKTMDELASMRVITKEK